MTWAAVALATAGLGVLTLNGFSVGYGEAITLVAAMLYALHIVGLGAWSKPDEAMGMSIVQIIVIAVICLVASAPGRDRAARRRRGTGCRCSTWRRSPARSPWSRQTWAQAHLAATRCAIIMSMEPVFAALFAVLLGGEDPTRPDARRRRDGAGRDADRRAAPAPQGRGRGPAHRGVIPHPVHTRRAPRSGSPSVRRVARVTTEGVLPWSSSCHRTPPTSRSRTSSSASRSVGGEAFVSKGVVRTIIGLVGDIDSFHHLNLRTLPGVADVHRISDPYKLVSRQHHPDRSTVWVGPAGHQVPIGPGHVHLHRRPVRRRDRRADPRGRADGPVGRRHDPARRGVQAAHLAVRLPGPGRRRAWRSSPTSRRATGHAGRDRGRRRPRRRRGRRARRHAPGRHPQHGQLRAAAGRRRVRQAGAAQARHDRHHRGVADGGRVHRPARQPRRRPVRARHPHLRAGDPQHPRHLRGAGRPGDQPPAGHRRPLARRRAARTSSCPCPARPSRVGADGVIVDVHPDPETALCDGPQALLGTELRELAQAVRRLPPVVGRVDACERVRTG